MNANRRSGQPPTRVGGFLSRPVQFLVAIALVLGACVFAALHFSNGSRRTPTVAGQEKEQSDSSVMSQLSWPDSSHSIPEGMDPKGELTTDVLDQIAHRTTPTIAEWIQKLRDAGIDSGIAAFNPPGTRPPLIGLAVPEDFVLPKGYIRHHQTTDDGQPIEAILMFDANDPPVDGAHRPISVPEDRIVTPELAPPGFPIRRIVIPLPAEQE